MTIYTNTEARFILHVNLLQVVYSMECVKSVFVFCLIPLIVSYCAERCAGCGHLKLPDMHVHFDSVTYKSYFAHTHTRGTPGA